jgi:hypothetical protein
MIIVLMNNHIASSIDGLGQKFVNHFHFKVPFRSHYIFTKCMNKKPGSFEKHYVFHIIIELLKTFFIHNKT